MQRAPFGADPLARCHELLGLYGDPRASAAYLLCDRHDPAALAYRIVKPDLSIIELTYGELRADSERFAAGLAALGIRPGDRVATLLGKSREYLVAVMAIWRLGAVHVPLFTAFAPPAIALRLIASGAKAVICDHAQQSKLSPGDAMPADASWQVISTSTSTSTEAGQAAAALNFGDIVAAHPPGFTAAALGGEAPFIQIYTSGTTGRPKGVVVPLCALASFHMYAEYALDVRADDVYWNAADPGWAYGLYYGVLLTFLTGASSVLFEGGFSAPTTYEILSRLRVTNFASAPTVFRSLRAAGNTVPAGTTLRCASAAGEPLTPEVNDWAARALGVQVHDHYGQTETGMLINNHHHPTLRQPLKPGAMGRAMPGWTIAVLRPDRDEPAAVGEVGRIACDLARSPLTWFRGYLDEPAKSAEKFSPDGRWYITGDVGRMDEQGYYYFSSRDDDVIIMAGYRIGPFEVESVLLMHPAVRECAVVAVPDALRGEVIESMIVLSEGRGASAELTEELQGWVKARYAAHAYPRQVHYAESLPKTPSGKIQRFIVREQLRQLAQERSACG